MYPDTRHGSLRPKRCLPAKLHFETAHTDYPETGSTHPCVESSRRFPKSERTIPLPQSAPTHAFLPIVTRSLPDSCPSLTKLGGGRQSFWAPSFDLRLDN